MHASMVDNASLWRVDHDIIASPTSLSPNDGPVWIAWSNGNYSGHWVESFPTAIKAVDELLGRLYSSYYPLWYSTSALVYMTDPDETDNAYPIVELTLLESDYGYTVSLVECL